MVQKMIVYPLVKPRFKEEQFVFCPGCINLDQLFFITRIFEGAWEFAQIVCMHFVGLETAFSCVPWGIL